MLMKKRIVSILLIAVLLLIGIPVSANSDEKVAVPSVSAQAAVLIEAGTGDILYGKEEHKQLSMASTTKIMTALLTVEGGALDEYFEVDAKAIQTEGTSMGLQEGDQVSLRTLAYGMLLQSGNDGANAAAVKVGGSVEKFVELMNERAKSIGMDNSSFATPSGLDDEKHYSTAFDMAKLAREALRNPVFAEICKQTSAQVEYGNPPYKRTLTNHNRLLREYEGTIGVKTGFTKKSGRCLVSAVERDGVVLIAVTLNAPNDWDDHKKLYEYGYSVVNPLTLDTSGVHYEIPVVGGTESSVPVVESAPVRVCISEEDAKNLQQVVTMDKFLYAPVIDSDVVGTVYYILDGEVLAKATLVPQKNIDAHITEVKENWTDKVKRFFSNIYYKITG